MVHGTTNGLHVVRIDRGTNSLVIAFSTCPPRRATPYLKFSVKIVPFRYAVQHS